MSNQREEIAALSADVVAFIPSKFDKLKARVVRSLSLLSEECLRLQFKEIAIDAVVKTNQSLTIRLATAEEQAGMLRKALEDIWDATGVVVSAGGVSGPMSRHLQPQINKIPALLRKTALEES